jgi:hypothetical protein
MGQTFKELQFDSQQGQEISFSKHPDWLMKLTTHPSL